MKRSGGLSITTILKTRRLVTFLSCAGVVSIIALAAAGNKVSGEFYAGLAVALLTAATIIGIVDLIIGGKIPPSVDLISTPSSNRIQNLRDRWVACGVALLAGASIQNWFTPGKVIAGWDVVPPDGTAWFGRLFAPWVWSGSNLGGPGGEELQLPWAAVLWIVRSLGGSPGLAQRLWYSLLIVAAVLAAYCLLRLLHITAMPAAIGALVYVFNPNSFAAAISPVYLVAMVLLAGLPACVLATSNHRLSFKKAVCLFGVSAPLLGYSYLNPPLTGMICLAVLASIFIAYAIEGRSAAKNAAKVVLGGGLLLLVTSAYWLVPSLVQLQDFSQATYTSASSWIWEEVRATLANGLWLNTSWAWDQTTFFPYAQGYSIFPLSFIKFLLPVVAFSSIPLTYWRVANDRPKMKRLVLGAAGLALFLIVFSTGTRLPGSVIFDPLYRLPFGWLLREPFRFLMVVGLAYGVLIAVTFQLLVEASRRIASSAKLHSKHAPLFRSLAVFILAILILAPAYPLFFGQYIPAQTKGNATSVQEGPHRVTFPAYWTNMANYLNGKSAPSGNLLALPPDGSSDIVPYRWGYFGVDAFMFYLFKRHVIAPNAKNYYGASTELINSVNTMASDLPAHDWSSFARLANALGVKLVLVRGDINTELLGIITPPPSALSVSLALDPNAILVHRDGPLELFLLRSPPNQTSTFVTVNSINPNLGDLSLLPPGTSLVSGIQRRGVEALLQFPPVNSWNLQKGVFSTTMFEQPGWNYRLLWLTASATSLVVAKTQAVAHSVSTFHSQSTPQSRGTLLRISLPFSTKSLLHNGNFSQGLWQKQVGDCNIGGVAKSPGSIGLQARVDTTSGPGGIPALSLSANADSACEAKTIDWKSGPVLISLWARTIRGSPPRICIWQAPNYGCPNTKILSKNTKWRYFHFSVQPQPNTTSLQIFLYADSNNAGLKTLTQYSNIRISSIPSQNLQPLLIGTPSKKISPRSVLTVTGEGFDKGWVAPRGYSRVLVDGLRIGWLGPSRLTQFRYSPGVYDRDGLLLSFAGFLAIGALAIVSILRRIARFRTMQRQ